MAKYRVVGVLFPMYRDRPKRPYDLVIDSESPEQAAADAQFAIGDEWKLDEIKVGDVTDGRTRAA